MRKKLAQLWLVARYCARQLAAAVTLIVLWLLSPIGFRELLLFAGSSLIGYGLYLVYPPAGFIAPGVIIAYVALFGVS